MVTLHRLWSKQICQGAFSDSWIKIHAVGSVRDRGKKRASIRIYGIALLELFQRNTNCTEYRVTLSRLVSVSHFLHGLLRDRLVPTVFTVELHTKCERLVNESNNWRDHNFPVQAEEHFQEIFNAISVKKIFREKRRYAVLKYLITKQSKL